jgi:hypothetical protein
VPSLSKTWRRLRIVNLFNVAAATSYASDRDMGRNFDSVLAETPPRFRSLGAL